MQSKLCKRNYTSTINIPSVLGSFVGYKLKPEILISSFLSIPLSSLFKLPNNLHFILVINIDFVYHFIDPV